MPFRHQVPAVAGAAAFGSLAGYSADGTTGSVARKRTTVVVPQQVGDPVSASVALLGFEPDRRLVHGEYDQYTSRPPSTTRRCPRPNASTRRSPTSSGPSGIA